MKPKFKINQEIFFMQDNKPVKRNIKGISFYQGEIQELHIKKNNEEDNYILYHTGSYESVKEHNVFTSMEELKKSLFES